MNKLYGMLLSILSLMVNNALYGAKGYVTNSGGNSVSIFDTTTNAVTGIVQDLTPATFNAPSQIAITPDGTTAYVVNSAVGANSVSVINVATDTVIQKITDASFSSPGGIAITPDGKTAYVTNINGNRVSIIDIATNTVSGTVTDSGTFNNPQGIAITPDGTKAYVANRGNNTVSVINLVTNTVIGTVANPNFSGPARIAITPDGKTAYVANNDDASVSVIDVVTDSIDPITPVIQNGNFNKPFDIAINPVGTKAYVTNQNNKVSVVDVATNSVDSTTPAVLNPNFSDPQGVIFTKDGATAYVVNLGSRGVPSSVSIITTATNTVADPGTVTDQMPATFNTPLFIAIVPSSSPKPTQAITISGAQKKNIFLTQTDYINIISWTTPTTVTPVSYILYRDAALTDVAGTVAATAPLFFADHNRNPTLSYAYYLVAVDHAGSKTLLGSVIIRGLGVV